MSAVPLTDPAARPDAADCLVLDPARPLVGTVVHVLALAATGAPVIGVALWAALTLL